MVSNNPHDPRRLNVERFSADAASLSGKWSLKEMPRLADAQTGAPGGLGAADTAITFEAVGEQRPPGGLALRAGLHLRARTMVGLVCQRCLQSMAWPLAIDHHYRFAQDEATAAELDADSDDVDVLVLAKALDLCQLAEDELLMALPIVPRHETCGMPVNPSDTAAEDPDAAAAGDPHPFAALAGWRPRSGS
jgi:uncharacterized protein